MATKRRPSKRPARTRRSAGRVRRIVAKLAAGAPADTATTESQAATRRLIRVFGNRELAATLTRLDRDQALARQWRDEAERQLAGFPVPPPRESTKPDGRTVIEFQEVPEAAKPADYIRRGTTLLLERIASARWLLTHGRRADQDLRAVAELARRLNGYLVRPLLEHRRKFRGGRQSKGDLWQIMVEIVRAGPPKLDWTKVMRQITESGRLTASKMTGHRLSYQDPPGRPRTIGPDAFQVKLTAVRKEVASKNT